MKTHKTPKISLLCLIMAIALLSSCSIQKRQYTKGYYVSFKSNPKNEKKTAAATQRMESIIIAPTLKIPSLLRSEELTVAFVVSSHAPSKVSNNSHSVLPVSQNKKVIKRSYIPKANFATKMFMIEPPKTSGKATAALVLGILALVTYYGALLMAVLAIVFGVKAIKQINAEPDKYKGKGMAKAGMVMGIIGCVILLAIIMLAA